MKKYYPLLSIVVAVLFLALPLIILSRSSSKDERPAVDGSSGEVSQRELRELQEQLTLLSSKLPKLERAVTDLQNAIDVPASQRPVAAGTLRRASTSGLASSNPRDAIPLSQDAQHETTVEIKAVASRKATHDHLEDVDPHAEQFSGPSAGALTAQPAIERDPPQSQAIPLAAATAGPPTASDVAAIAPAPPVAAATAASESVEGPPASKTAMMDRPVPEPVDVLTASELAREATKNLRERVRVDDPAEEDAAEKDLVEIILQTPQDGMTVNRVEQLYAQSRAPGWPVVLVRSSFDDEEWWAQPIGGRRGTQIMSRVHFGNDSTPRGSAFSMVILLLDGYEEAVRFRTARRFTKIPKGIRRSREFMFVLK